MVKKEALPTEIKNILYTEDLSYNQYLLEKMEATVEEMTRERDTNYTVKCKILEGSPLEQIVKYTNSEKADLVMLGRKNETQGSGIILTRIARRVHCSTMIVTEDSELYLDDILVCADFSEWSKLAVEKAIEMI